jgi:hypothetical protein
MSQTVPPLKQEPPRPAEDLPPELVGPPPLSRATRAQRIALLVGLAVAVIAAFAAL